MICLSRPGGTDVPLIMSGAFGKAEEFPKMVLLLDQL